MLTFGSLFSGIGGFDLGLERAGMRVLWQCEIDGYAQRVLEKHWPDVLRVPDIRDVRAGTVEPVDVICGGFPCQDISYASANTNAPGIAGERSGLWSEMFRVVREFQPRYVLVENVPALLARGLHVVLGDLATIGYDAEWDCLPASAFGAPHRRDRIWLVGYPHDGGQPTRAVDAEAPRMPGLVADSERRGRSGRPHLVGRDDPARHEAERGEGAGHITGGDPQARARGAAVADSNGTARHAEGPAGEALPGPEALQRSGRRGSSEGNGWAVEPDVGRVAHGIPARMDRLRALGNALVPDIAEWIGRRILEYEREQLDAAA